MAVTTRIRTCTQNQIKIALKANGHKKFFKLMIVQGMKVVPLGFMLMGKAIGKIQPMPPCQGENIQRGMIIISWKELIGMRLQKMDGHTFKTIKKYWLIPIIKHYYRMRKAFPHTKE